MQFLWGMINVMQLITFQSLMSINIPALPRSINNMILEFSQMDLLPSEEILTLFLDLETFNDYPLNDYFDQGGFSTKHSILNLGSTFIYLALSVPLLLITLLVNFLPPCKANSLPRCLRDFYLSKFYLSFFIRLILEDYLVIAVSVGINMYNITNEPGIGSGSFSNAIALGFLASFFFVPFV